MKKNIVLSALTIISLSAKAQVSDVSLVIAPSVSYNWFDKKTTIDNGVMYGLQAGFGFGRSLELKGIYEKSVDMKQNFSQYQGDINKLFPNFQLENRKLDIERIGGELKANIPSNAFAPFFTLGTGVQTIKRSSATLVGSTPNPIPQDYKSQQLYTSAGLGFKINMGKRVTLNLEGKTHIFNLAPSSLIYDQGGTSQFDTWVNNQNEKVMFNWQASAGLQFYLGGSTFQATSELDKAYRQQFSSGLRGVKFVLEPGTAYYNFDENSGLRNTYLIGGAAGFDFTDFIGIRGYYYQATKDETLSFQTDNLAMYGVDFVGRLNVSRGIVPYISVGGGYLNVADNYQPRTVTTKPTSAYYAKGSVGVTAPIGTRLELFGAANLLYSVSKYQDFTDLRTPNQLTKHTGFNAGIRILMGKRANAQKAVALEVEKSVALAAEAYEAQIKILEQELAEAYKTNDAQKAVTIIKEKQALQESIIMPVVKEEKVAIPVANNPEVKTNYIKLTPAELEALVDKIVKSVDASVKTLTVEERIDKLEKLLLQINSIPVKIQNPAPPVVAPQMPPVAPAPVTAPAPAQVDINAANEKLLEELKKLNEKIEAQNKEISQLKTMGVVHLVHSQNNTVPSTTTNIIVPGNTTTTATVAPTEDTVIYHQPSAVDTAVVYTPAKEEFFNLGFAPYAGANFGGATTFNVGLRAYRKLGNTPFIFMPEAFIATGNQFGFGVSGNILYPLALQTLPVQPYVGAGIGINYLGYGLKFQTNALVGAAYKLNEKGSLFADYSVRGAFKNNQIAVGYRYRF